MEISSGQSEAEIDDSLSGTLSAQEALDIINQNMQDEEKDELDEDGIGVDLDDLEIELDVHDAAERGDLTEVELFLKIEPDPNIGNDHGTTPLMKACIGGSSEVVACLIRAGANLDAQNEWGNTALHYACVNCHLPLIRLLLESGADPDIANNYDVYPADELVELGPVQRRDAEALLIRSSLLKRGEARAEPEAVPATEKLKVTTEFAAGQPGESSLGGLGTVPSLVEASSPRQRRASAPLSPVDERERSGSKPSRGNKLYKWMKGKLGGRPNLTSIYKTQKTTKEDPLFTGLPRSSFSAPASPPGRDHHFRGHPDLPTSPLRGAAAGAAAPLPPRRQARSAPSPSLQDAGSSGAPPLLGELLGRKEGGGLGGGVAAAAPPAERTGARRALEPLARHQPPRATTPQPPGSSRSDGTGGGVVGEEGEKVEDKEDKVVVDDEEQQQEALSSLGSESHHHQQA